MNPLLNARRQPLLLQELLLVDEVVNHSASQEVIVDKFNFQLTYNTLKCLRLNNPINDEIINFYMCLLQDRDKILTELSNCSRKSSHFFSCFFISSLLRSGEYNYNNVKRWTEGKNKINIFLKDKIFIPVCNDENNSYSSWAMIVVFMQLKEIHYYDSMSRPNVIERYLQHVLHWLVDESIEKHNNEYNIDINEWQLFALEAIYPQQSGSFDCGIFTILCADFVSDNIPLNDSYSQPEIPQYRQKICASILRGELNY